MRSIDESTERERNRDKKLSHKILKKSLRLLDTVTEQKHPTSSS